MGEAGEAAPGRPTAPVVLVGMMGSGKTAVGQALAARLRVPFRDSDAALVEASRLSIPEIFARDGEAFFRDREAEVIRRLLDEGVAVISTGGGAWLSAATRAAVAGRGWSVWLRATPEVLWSRVKGRGGRPLLEGPDPRGALERLAEARAPAYAQAAIVVDSARDRTVEAMAGLVAARLSEAGAMAA